MEPNSIKTMLNTMCEYNTSNIRQVFSTEDGHSLSIRCLPGTMTFEITNSQTQELIQHDSLEETTTYILAFLASHTVNLHS